MAAEEIKPAMGAPQLFGAIEFPPNPSGYPDISIEDKAPL
jgi:hypothetical protein